MKPFRPYLEKEKLRKYMGSMSQLAGLKKYRLDDGPSAGVTMVTSLVSALSGIPARRDVAMTGEISLRGKVLAIGGLREKTMAAYSAGVKTVLIPEDNMRDFDELDNAVKEAITFIPCKTVSDVLKNALAYSAASISEKKEDDDVFEPIANMIPSVIAPSQPAVTRR